MKPSTKIIKGENMPKWLRKLTIDLLGGFSSEEYYMVDQTRGTLLIRQVDVE